MTPMPLRPDISRDPPPSSTSSRNPSWRAVWRESETISYAKCTDFDDPCQQVIGGDNPLHVIAIDHLPSLLPLESSEDFGSQLLKHLLNLSDESDPVWQGALGVFEAKTRELR